MLGKVIIENGVKKIQALTADTGVGAPVGSYLYLEKKSNPQGYLYCDGSTFDETVYPALYQYLGTNVLPDWREFSAVGAEQNTTNVYDAQTNPNGVIHDHDVFTQGQAKDDQLQDHKHYTNQNNVDVDDAGSSQARKGSVYNTTTSLQTTGVDGARYGSVTRGKSRAVFIYIKATSGLTENQQENVLNTINENNSYSTEEHPTGKKWIDGKPIYRKVIDLGTLHVGTGGVEQAHNITNLDRFTKLYSYAIASNGETLTLPWIDGNTIIRLYATSTKIGIGSVSLTGTWNATVILEYTKTTD